MPDLDKISAEVVAAAQAFVTRSLQDVSAQIKALEQRIAEIPSGKDGSPGEPGKAGADGTQGKDGLPGMDGKEGVPGRDGRDGLPGLQGEKGIDGTHGKDGRDGFGLEDFDVSLEGRTLALRFTRGELVVERTLTIPAVMDAGIYRSGNAYAKGDGVTQDGSWWIAQTETTDKPGTSGAWRLAAKRGRDGKDAAPLPDNSPKIVRLK